MRLIFLGNCGFFLTDGNCGLLFDAPNGLHTAFDGVSETLMENILAHEPPYDTLTGAFFTHRHSDHYDKKRLKTLLDAFPGLAVFSANGATPPDGRMTVGTFTVLWHLLPHSGDEFRDTPHCVFLVTCGCETVYVTGDADWNAERHFAFLGDLRPTCIIANPNYLNLEEGRKLLSLSRKQILCHLPVNAEDRFGILRKFRTSASRYGSLFPDLTAVTQYPMEIEL